MRDAIFTQIITYLQTCSKFKGEDGTSRVFDWPTTSSGFPYVVVGSESLESEVLDSASDARRYNFVMQIVGEKFGTEGGMTQSDALKAMRDTEDAVLAIFDAHNLLGRPDIIIRTMPTRSQYGYTDGGSRVVLTINVSVEIRASINN